MIFLLRGRLSAIALALHTLNMVTSTSSRRADTRRIKWHDTGKGSIALEEAWSIPEFSTIGTGGETITGLTVAEINADLFDIYDQRLTRMDAKGVDFASPCEFTYCINPYCFYSMHIDGPFLRLRLHPRHLRPSHC